MFNLVLKLERHQPVLLMLVNFCQEITTKLNIGKPQNLAKLREKSGVVEEQNYSQL